MPSSQTGRLRQHRRRVNLDSFTIKHPLVCLFYVWVLAGAFEFAYYFTPLISMLSERTAEFVLYEFVPGLAVTLSAVILVRSFLYRMLFLSTSRNPS